jgi:hypothetical protein
MMKVLTEEIVNGELTFRNYTTTTQMAPFLLVNHPGPGRPFWAFNSVPPGKIIGADFTNAPLATASPDENLALINGITTNPADVIVYAPPPP